jgi:hypothetical protein
LKIELPQFACCGGHHSKIGRFIRHFESRVIKVIGTPHHASDRDPWEATREARSTPSQPFSYNDAKH